nr:hypothetical protein [Tanacetum cinerariifolium]
MRMIEIDASDCGPEDVLATPLINALRLPHKLLLMKVEALRLIDGLNANGRRTAHSSHINISKGQPSCLLKRESSRSGNKVWNNMLNYAIRYFVITLLSVVAEFTEHTVMAARAAGEFSKAENDAPGLQLAIDFAEFAEHAVMAARAAGEFSKAENDVPGLQLAIDCVFLIFLENKANALGLL